MRKSYITRSVNDKVSVLMFGEIINGQVVATSRSPSGIDYCQIALDNGKSTVLWFGQSETYDFVENL